MQSQPKIWIHSLLTAERIKSFTSSALLKIETLSDQKSDENKPTFTFFDLLSSAFIDFGGGERDRTDDPLLAKQVLSQLSYAPR